MKSIDFWFSIGSTYSYLTVMRLAGVERDTGVGFDWRPFSVRVIMREMNNIPFADKPAKTRYMWRDLGRRAKKYGLEARLPAPYPLEHFDLANRVAILGREEGWCGDYVVASYRRWIGDGQPAGSQPNLGESLTEIGQDPERIIEIANAAETEAGYRAATDEARSVGIFGSTQLRRRRRAVLGRRPPGRRHLLAPDRRRRVSAAGLAARPSDPPRPPNPRPMTMVRVGAAPMAARAYS